MTIIRRQKTRWGNELMNGHIGYADTCENRYRLTAPKHLPHPPPHQPHRAVLGFRMQVAPLRA